MYNKFVSARCFDIGISTNVIDLLWFNLILRLIGANKQYLSLPQRAIATALARPLRTNARAVNQGTFMSAVRNAKVCFYFAGV